MIVTVEAAARLHFGVLDLRGSTGRWFGGIGAGAPGPTMRVSVSRPEDDGPAAGGIEATGDDAERAREFGRRFLAAHGLPELARISVEQALPRHSGLGSGTQLALSVARALAELHGIAADAPALARAVGRARRSAIGTWTFAGGGLVLEGGHRRGHDAEVDTVAPLLARIPFPPAWHCVVAIPDGGGTMTGPLEAAAFDALPVPPEGDERRVAQLVLSALLPAVADDDLATFGAALTEIQLITGGWWAAVQGGTFAEPSRELIDIMRASGVAGVGQSSWGPTVYGVTADGAEAAALTARLGAALGTAGTVHAGPFRSTGARVWST